MSMVVVRPLRNLQIDNAISFGCGQRYLGISKMWAKNNFPISLKQTE